jgi:hypothetical protein
VFSGAVPGEGTALLRLQGGGSTTATDKAYSELNHLRNAQDHNLAGSLNDFRRVVRRGFLTGRFSFDEQVVAT